MLVTLHDGVTGARRLVFVDSDRAEPMAAFARRGIAATGADLSGASAQIAVDGVIVPEGATVAQSGLREGSFVSLLRADSEAVTRPRLVESTMQLRVVSGIGAGRILHSGPGSLKIGTSDSNDVIVRDQTAAPEDLALVVERAGPVRVGFLPDVTPACAINGESPQDGQQLEAGDQIVYDDVILEIGYAETVVAAVEVEETSGEWKYNRPPRILPAEPSSLFRLPSEPAEPDRVPLPILMSLIPLVLAGGLALLYRNPVMLAFGIMSPVMLIGSYFTSRRASRRRYKRLMADYVDVKERTEEDAAAALAAERVQRRLDAPDAALAGLIGVGPLPRLWERRTDEDTWLALRMGTATQPSDVALEDPEQLQHRQRVVWDIHNAPVTVALPTAGVVGLASLDSSPDQPRRVAQWMAAQIGVLHSPKDVHLYLLEGYAEPSGPFRTHPWEFLAWLPHTQPGLGQDTLRTIAVSTTALGTRVAELVQTLDARLAAARASGDKSPASPSIVLVIDGASRLRPLPGIVRLLKEGPRVGIYSICVERDERLLPEECHTVLVVDRHLGQLRTQKAASHERVLVDLVEDEWLDWVARGLAPIVDITPSVNDAAIPQSSRLLEVLKLDPPTPDALRARWSLNPRSTTAIIGESLDGAFAIDLTADGPHGLVGGTTGSGKSEFLQTLVASLAVANSPAEMNFVLVDYKGGAAFKDCSALPHTVGMVTDLDAHLVERALTSLSAELRRREHLLSETGAKDIEDYQDLATRRDLTPIPRLLVVVDEFASLARELPDFVTGLVNLAQRGRSLGIHLILATQRPSGAVSPEIRANTNLRIALRMTDGAESADVIDAPDAGSINPAQRGRAFARLGANALIPFQTSRIGGRAPSRGEADAADPVMRPMRFTDLADPAPRPVERSVAGDVEVTDLRLLVDAVVAATAAVGVPRQRSPWLPALPEVLALEDIKKHNTTPGSSPGVWFGIEDRPDQQNQVAASFSLEDDGHLYVVGSPRSGRTTTLRTIAVSAATTHEVRDLHIYAIDAGNGGLLPLRSFPHVGTVTLRHQTDQIARLISKLRGLVKERQHLLAGSGVSDLTQLRALRRRAGEDAPAQVLVLLDGWESFQGMFESVDGGALLESVLFLLREGASVGVHLIVSGDRQLLTSGRMATLADRKLLLRLVERSDYALIGLRPKSLPETIPNGRAFNSTDAAEVHVAAIAPDLDPAEQSARITQIGAELTAHYSGTGWHQQPLRIAEIPTRFTYADALAERGMLESEGQLFVGLGGEDVEPITFDPRTAPTFVVAGNSGSGRSTALLALAMSALRNDYDVVVVAPRRSPLRTLAGKPGVHAVLTGSDLTQEQLEPLLDGKSGRLTIVIVDDAELLREASAKQWLRTAIAQASERHLAFIVGGDADEIGKGFSSWLLEAIKGRRGILFRPTQLTDGDTIGIKLSRSDLTAATEHPVGRGYMPGPGFTPTLTQTPDAVSEMQL
ncbi:S-DNA-T family DNA segregation ATPase FtsK/SpoIIIE [Microbacterium endophyticum]|uniref:S-DNA-T family DNA segregation ATPase FtsK/SpoIIIE n=1 Tax=Microbacterium endophyticum TaxID=1526412 RepID=A0A7W4V1F6_9MICO|nr:FtsK/SpoIIIE domain-containing protein [Microbacterium endophyticum]MBB2975118.1 S-DNA-T family DNA segregation ATPase FtsK/SpoIIIE [Microbacterium endophyticum]NIK37342.1 S-DNA-T family DNA segregation ATPase FtsK/SpoIIIE [Microbacterium endophyticum]